MQLFPPESETELFGLSFSFPAISNIEEFEIHFKTLLELLIHQSGMASWEIKNLERESKLVQKFFLFEVFVILTAAGIS